MSYGVHFTPSWKRHEDAMHNPDPKIQREATDKFMAEREHEIRTDPEARRWEEGRKQSIARNKPLWVKKHDQP